MYRSHRPAIGTDLQTGVISGEYEHGAPAIHSVFSRTEIAGAFSITARRKVSDSLLHKCRRLLRPGFISFGQKRLQPKQKATRCGLRQNSAQLLKNTLGSRRTPLKGN